MQVVGRSGMSKGIKPQSIKCKLQKSVPKLVLANGSDVDRIYVAIVLWIMHGVLKGCQPHIEVVIRTSFDISDQKISICKGYGRYADPEDGVQVSVVTSDGFGFAVNRGKIDQAINAE